MISNELNIVIFEHETNVDVDDMIFEGHEWSVSDK